MKKKLKLNDIEVKSFVTKLNHNKQEAINGGAKDLKETMYSCLQYISCHMTDSIADPA